MVEALAADHRQKAESAIWPLTRRSSMRLSAGPVWTSSRRAGHLQAGVDRRDDGAGVEGDDDVNVTGVFHTVKASVPDLEQGTGGSIVMNRLRRRIAVVPN